MIIGILASSSSQPWFLNAWATNGVLATNRSRPTPLAFNSVIYYLTGDPGGASSNTVMNYSSGNGTWTANTLFPYSCLGPWATVNGGTVWMGNGFNGGTNVYTSTNMVSFTAQTGYPINGLRSCTATALNGSVYVSGGYSDPLGGYQRGTYRYNSGTSAWVAQTNYPYDTDTPATWTFDGSSKYYFTQGGSTYYYTGSGSWVLDVTPPTGLYGAFNNSTVFQGRVYLNAAGTQWYSWNGSGSWRTETASAQATFGGAIMDGALYGKRDGYNTDCYKATIG